MLEEPWMVRARLTSKGGTQSLDSSSSLYCSLSDATTQARLLDPILAGGDTGSHKGRPTYRQARGRPGSRAAEAHQFHHGQSNSKASPSPSKNWRRCPPWTTARL